jgi:hypothetical protein
MIPALTARRDRQETPRQGRGAPKRPSSEPLSADVPAFPSARSPRLNGYRSAIVTRTGKPLRSLAQAHHPKSEVGAAQKVAERREGRDGWNVSSPRESLGAWAAQSGGALGGCLLDRRGARGALGSSPPAPLGPSSVICGREKRHAARYARARRRNQRRRIDQKGSTAVRLHARAERHDREDD